MKPQRIAKPFVHEPGVGSLDGFARDEHDVVQFGVATGCPAPEVNGKKTFSGRRQIIFGCHAFFLDDLILWSSSAT
jgi:hypothetical protein